MRAFPRIIPVIPLGLMAAIVTAVAVYLLAFGFSGVDFQPQPGARRCRSPPSRRWC